MLEVADIFRLHGAAYRAHVRDRLFPGQVRAMQDILACRTAYFGGHIKQCDHCREFVYVYHSCGNRHCPKCHREQTEQWIEKQRARLLPCPYYLLTFTLPAELRPLALAQQKKVYGLLMRCAAGALQKLALDPRYLGARLGCLAVLHTWSRAMLYHPHVHLLVTAGGMSPDGSQWFEPKHAAFLVPVEALSVIFRAKLCAAFKRAGLLKETPAMVWKKKWVVHCQHAGYGQKVLEYLGRYVFRVAITNSRLEQINNDQVTFRYRDNRSQKMCHSTITGIEFIRRFLQHILPRGCAKVRYYGIWSNSCHRLMNRAFILLTTPSSDSHIALNFNESLSETLPTRRSTRCPRCKIGQLIQVEVIYPQRRAPPW